MNKLLSELVMIKSNIKPHISACVDACFIDSDDSDSDDHDDVLLVFSRN